MSSRLPELIEPEKMAQAGRLLKGTLAIQKLKRLEPLLFQNNGSNQGDVDVELEFGTDASGQLNVTGAVETNITLQCQRCMQALDLHIAEKISLAIVYSSEQANELPSHYEPLLLEDEEEMVSLPELIEDEILLALPSVPLHDSDECQVKQNMNTAGNRQEQNSESQQESERKNPFAVLEQLKSKD